jgi:NADPH:quinone reductase-like Zn-dependent oxidoreductase
MKAVRIHSFGGPEVLRFEDVPVPAPQPNEIVAAVHAAGINPVDWKIREGHVGEPRLPQIMGSDFSGVVQAIGPDVREFRVGDAVFGVVADESGSYAEFAAAPVSQIAKKPGTLDHVRAAALPIASLTAWQALFDTAQLQAGQKILIHAAAGGVGSFAVQFARWKGAHVIGTASARNAGSVRALGAAEVIDYHSTRFEDVAHEVDVVFDTVGGETQERSWKVLKRGGILVSIVQPPPSEKAAGHGVRGVFMISKPRGDELARIVDLVVQGQVKVVVETVLPLSEARRGQELSQSGHVHGKIVLVTDAHGAASTAGADRTSL